MAKKEVQFDVVAKDEASKVVDKIADAAEKLEKSDPTVTIDAEAGDAKHTVEGLDNQLDKLTDADKIVVLALRAGAAKAELTDLAGDLATIDATDPAVDVKFSRYAEVSGQLEQLEQQMESIAETSVDPNVGDEARAKLAGIGEEAAKTQGAVHSMAGNALGDFAATTSGIGPLGEAVGQLTEMAAGGEAGLKDLAAAGLGLGAVAGAMVIVNLAMKSFADTAARTAKIKAFRDDEVKAFTQSLKEGTDAAGDLVDRLAEVGEVTEEVTVSFGKIDITQLMDLSPLLAEAGINAKDFAKGVTGSAADLATFTAAVKATNLSVEEQTLIIAGATSEFENMEKAKANHERFAKVFGNETKQINLFADATQGMRNELADADKAAFGLGTRIGDAADATKDLERAYQELSDQISNEQALIDLADQVDAVTDAGNKAITAQKDANEAIKKNASDATEKQREAEQAMRDYQTAVNSTKDDIIKLAQTANVSPVELKATLDKVDQGDLNGAKADAEAWSKRNPVVLTAELRVALIKALGSGLGPAIVVPGSTSTTNVTQFLAAPDARRQAREMTRTARVNGR